MFTSERLALAERYVALLADGGVRRGLIGPREAPRLWQRHILNCAVWADLVPPGVEVADIGSGAGLPGVVLAIARPDVRVTLVEPLLRRTTFLDEVVGDLGLGNVTVHRARADELHGGAGFDVVTSRAVAPLARLLDWSMPLVRPYGVLLALKGSSVAQEVAEHEDSWTAWGCSVPEVLETGSGVVSPPTTVLRVAWAEPSAITWPPARPRPSRSPSSGPVGRAKPSRAPTSRQQRRHRDG